MNILNILDEIIIECKKVISSDEDNDLNKIGTLISELSEGRNDGAFFEGELNHVRKNVVEYHGNVSNNVISAHRERRKQRMDDEEENGGGSKGSHGNTRLPYGLAKGEGIDTTGMEPKEVWVALEGKGYSASAEYSKLKERGKETSATSSYKKSSETVRTSSDAIKKTTAHIRELWRQHEEARKEERKLMSAVDSADRAKQHLEHYGLTENDRERIEQEYAELKKWYDDNDIDRKSYYKLSDEERKKREQLSDLMFKKEWFEDYYDAPKTLQSDYEAAQKKKADIEQQIRQAEAERNEHRAAIRKITDKQPLRQIKLYTDSERQSVKKDITLSKLFQNLNEEGQTAIRNSLDDASDMHLAVLRKTANKVRIISAEETMHKGSHYAKGSGTLALDEDDKKNPRVFWHEYGHYLDDFKSSGLEGDLSSSKESVSEYSEREADSFSEILHDSVELQSADYTEDIRETLEKYFPGKFKVEPYETTGYAKIMDAATGEEVEFDLDVTSKIVKEYCGHEKEEYLKEIGYPEDVNWGDYYETYTTPKRHITRTREKFKGAAEQYEKKNAEYWQKREEVLAAHPEYSEKMIAFGEERRRRENAISAVSDCFCGISQGRFGSIYGDHSQSYWRMGRHIENEWAANIFEMSMNNNQEALDLLSALLPRTMKKVQGAFKEWLWINSLEKQRHDAVERFRERRQKRLMDRSVEVV